MTPWYVLTIKIITKWFYEKIEDTLKSTRGNSKSSSKRCLNNLQEAKKTKIENEKPQKRKQIKWQA